MIKKEKYSTIFLTAILSGFLIGIGNLVFLTIENKYLGAGLFSLGLLTIICNGLWLFTGKIGYAAKIHWLKLLVCLLGNIIGTIQITALVVFSRPELSILYESMLFVKCNKDFIRLFIDGCICGGLMFLAAHSKKPYITIIAVMVFILLGTEHSIADAPYFFIFGRNPICILQYIVILIGNCIGSIFCYWIIKSKDNS